MERCYNVLVVHKKCITALKPGFSDSHTDPNQDDALL